MQIARSSGNPGKECKHLERTKNAKPAVLISASLQDMLSKGIMSSEWIFQESPGTLMETLDIQTEDIDDLESHIVENSISCEQQHVNTKEICSMTDYIITQIYFLVGI